MKAGPAGFGGFSPPEMRQRREALEAVMAAEGVQHALLYGANRAGSAVAWLTQWPVTREALVLVTPGEPDVLLVNFYNHIPHAARRVPSADVRWAGDRPAATVVDLLRERGGQGEAVGFVGPISHGLHAGLADGRRVVDLGSAYTRLRLHKSSEEIDALRLAAELTDVAVGAMLDEQPVVGCTEHELLARLEQSYVSRGGVHHIHYLGVTAMMTPESCVPAQWPSDRRVARGDLLTFEVSAGVAPDYSGQLLRTATVDAEPTNDVLRLHAAASEAFAAVEAALRPGVTAADLVVAAEVIEQRSLTTVDDLVHGFGGGYLPPVIGSRSRPIRPVPDFVLEAGMTVVVQPNVVTLDRRLGVQTGELLQVTEHGSESLHGFRRGLLEVR